MYNYPEKIMGNVYWSFTGTEPFYTLKSFVREVKDYYNQLDIEELWDADEIVLEVPIVQIQYLYMEYDKVENDFIEIEPIITLKARNGSAFTSGELLYSIHNEVIKNFANTTAIYFEGFQLWEESQDKEVPLYFLMCGS
jgi:hypothetical protein